MTTVNIPLVTVPVGTFTAGPSTVADSENAIVLVINRNVTNGFNSQPGTTTMNMVTFQSNDSGATWHELAEALIVGGVFVGKDGVTTITQSTVQTTLNPGTGREVKAVLTVAGSSVAVSGTLTIT